MTSTGSLYRINVEEEKYYLYSTYSEDKQELQIQLTDGIYSCQGKVPKEELEDLCNQADMDLGKYINLLKEAVGITKEANKFSYVISQNDLSVEFSWKHVLSNGMKFQLGSVTLQKDDQPNITSMLDAVAQQLEEMKSRCRSLEESRKLFESEYKAVTKRMESYTDTKKNIEQDLYSKFCVLLNSKKARIRELKQQVETNASSSWTKKAPSNERDKKDTDTDTESDRDTDDERSATEQHTKGTDILETSTPDIILDEQIADDDDRPRKNRKRIRSSRSKTPTNAKIPRTTSIARPKRQSSTGSNNSQKERKTSSEEMNADTLLEML